MDEFLKSLFTPSSHHIAGCNGFSEIFLSAVYNISQIKNNSLNYIYHDAMHNENGCQNSQYQIVELQVCLDTFPSCDTSTAYGVNH